MDDFERDLSRLLRDTQQHTPYEPEHRQRLHAGIRSRRRSRLLWKAGGSAVAVAGLSVGLALLPNMLTRAQPADHRPQPATSSTPSQDSGPTSDSPDPSTTPTRPESSAPATTTGGSTPPGGPSTTISPTPTATASESRTTSAPPTPPPSPTPTTAPPSPLEETQEPSASATE
ncbi:cellulase [Streptomyces coeruleorubidus]|jgi:cytoskeletal protein RodZ|uniref:cellulase n=1 Tax=Streptomyces coeruleorubidus TaxID=116188 RepID=UPI0033A9900E